MLWDIILCVLIILSGMDNLWINPSETNDISLNKDFIALTQQNITHNIIINKDSNRIIFKK